MGNETCGGLPGSLGHYATDSATLAEWGVDLVKAKACGIKDVRSCNSGKYYLITVIHEPNILVSMYLCGVHLAVSFFLISVYKLSARILYISSVSSH